MSRRLAVGAVVLGLHAASGTASAQGAAPSPPAAAAPSAAKADARQGIVRLERSGQLLGQGVVLRSDGRILTALSAIGHGNYVRARYSDGALLPVRVVSTDRGWDLALLAPEGAHWATGLRPSVGEVAPGATGLRRFRARGALGLEEGAASVEARRALLGRDGVMLEDALVLGGRWGTEELGSPLCDEAGEVLAVAVQACAPEPATSCRLETFGAPVGALKRFLKQAPAREPLPAARLGMRGVAAHEGSVAGVRVMLLEPGSPAAAAGLRAANGGAGGDLVVAVEGVPVTTVQELHDAINRVALAGSGQPSTAPRAGVNSGAPANSDQPGRDEASPSTGAAARGERRVRLLVFGAGKFREAMLPLSPPLEVRPAEPKPAPDRAAPPPAPGSPSAPPAPRAPSGALLAPWLLGALAAGKQGKQAAPGDRRHEHRPG